MSENEKPFFAFRLTLEFRKQTLGTCMNPRNQAGITLVEVVVCVVIGLFLCLLAIPPVTSGSPKTPLLASLSNLRQLQLTCEQLAIDGATTGDTNLAWPGHYTSYGAWVTNVVPAYLSTNDFCKIVSAPGLTVPSGRLPRMDATAIRLYAVGSESPTNAVLLTSANFTNTPTGGEALNPSAKPFGNKGFVVFRKGGSGSVLLPKQVGQTNIIGSFVPLCR